LIPTPVQQICTHVSGKTEHQMIAQLEHITDNRKSYMKNSNQQAIQRIGNKNSEHVITTVSITTQFVESQKCFPTLGIVYHPHLASKVAIPFPTQNDKTEIYKSPA